MDNLLNKLKKLLSDLRSSRKAKKPSTKELEGKMLSFQGGHQAYRVALQNARYMSVVIIALVAVIIAESLVILWLGSDRTIQPMFLNAYGTGKDMHVKVTPIDPHVQGYDIALENSLRSYIKNRETRDLVADVQRMREVLAFSGESVWDSIRKGMQEDKLNYDKRVKENVGRSVNIKHVSRLDTNIYQIEWEAVDYQLVAPKAGEPEKDVIGRKTWVSVLKITIVPFVKIAAEEKYMNPMGIKVIRYSVSPKEESHAKK